MEDHLTHIVHRLVVLARANSRDARTYRKRGENAMCESMAQWHAGRAGGYLAAARMVQGGVDARTRNYMSREKATTVIA